MKIKHNYFRPEFKCAISNKFNQSLINQSLTTPIPTTSEFFVGKNFFRRPDFILNRTGPDSKFSPVSGTGTQKTHKVFFWGKDSLFWGKDLSGEKKVLFWGKYLSGEKKVHFWGKEVLFW
jgi:hypothetical protein